jgi:tetratricopeptide (TPR) repeat protein
MREVIQANARYWLRVLQGASNERPILESDLRGAAKAIEAALRIPELWEITKTLAHALHPHMEQRGFWADWDDCLQVLAGRAKQQSDEQAEAEILLWRATIQRQRGDFQGSAFSSRKSWQLYRHEKNRAGLARVFSQLGDAYRLQGQFWRAELLCQAAICLFNGDAYLQELARSENSLGLVYFDQLRYQEALSHFITSETLWRKVNDSYGLAKVLQNLGELHRRSDDLEKALAYLEQAVEHYLAAGDQIYAATTLVNIGNVNLNQGDWSRAEAIYLHAETTLRRAGNSLDLATVRHNLGIVYTRLEVWNEAEACFSRALEQWRARGDIWMEANTLGEMGMLHLAHGDQAKTKSYLDEAWELIRGRSGAHFTLLRQELAGRRKLALNF